MLQRNALDLHSSCCVCAYSVPLQRVQLAKEIVDYLAYTIDRTPIIGHLSRRGKTAMLAISKNIKERKIQWAQRRLRAMKLRRIKTAPPRLRKARLPVPPGKSQKRATGVPLGPSQSAPHGTMLQHALSDGDSPMNQNPLQLPATQNRSPKSGTVGIAMGNTTRRSLSHLSSSLSYVHFVS